MGVTIHFEGQLHSEAAYELLIGLAIDFADAHTMPYKLFAETEKHLTRVKDEAEWDYQGPVKGIKIQPNDNTDPLWLEFDEDLYVQDFCKTQFADSQTHVSIIELLELLQPCFKKLLVEDEGCFWDTHDLSELQQNMNDCFQAIEGAKAGNPDLQGPFRAKNGRIIDLM